MLRFVPGIVLCNNNNKNTPAPLPFPYHQPTHNAVSQKLTFFSPLARHNSTTRKRRFSKQPPKVNWRISTFHTSDSKGTIADHLVPRLPL